MKRLIHVSLSPLSHSQVTDGDNYSSFQVRPRQAYLAWLNDKLHT